MVKPTGAAALPATGERYLPEMGGVIQLEHLHRYAIAADLAAGKDVVDVASGEGYGSALLARTAKSVRGVDVSEEAVAFASELYPSVQFVLGDAAEIPLETGSADLVVSFETIEHHDRHQEMIDEIHRILRPDGVLVISSPEKRVYSDLTQYDNPYHVKELYADEFEALLRTRFRHVFLYGQNVVANSLLKALPLGRDRALFAYAGSDRQLHEQDAIWFEPMYLVAVCSNTDAPPPSLPGSVFLHSSRDVLIEIGRQSVVPEVSIDKEILKSPELIEQSFDNAIASLGVTKKPGGLIHGNIERGASDWSGWARNIDHGSPAQYVIIGNERVSVVLYPQVPRPDVVAEYLTLSSYLCGVSMPAKFARMFEDGFQACAVDSERRGYSIGG